MYVYRNIARVILVVLWVHILCGKSPEAPPVDGDRHCTVCRHVVVLHRTDRRCSSSPTWTSPVGRIGQHRCVWDLAKGEILRELEILGRLVLFNQLWHFDISTCATLGGCGKAVIPRWARARQLFGRPSIDSCWHKATRWCDRSCAPIRAQGAVEAISAIEQQQGRQMRIE